MRAAALASCIPSHTPGHTQTPASACPGGCKSVNCWGPPCHPLSKNRKGPWGPLQAALVAAACGSLVDCQGEAGRGLPWAGAALTIHPPIFWCAFTHSFQNFIVIIIIAIRLFSKSVEKPIPPPNCYVSLGSSSSPKAHLLHGQG